MKNQTIKIDKNHIQSMGERYFKRMCGEHTIQGEQKDTFLREIQHAEEHVINHMNPKAVFSYYEMNGSSYPMIIENEIFSGGVFNYYNQPSVKGILIYLLTIGNLFKRDDMRLLEQYYIDAWGSAYVEAAHDVLKMKLELLFSLKDKPSKPYFVSDPFGPGYFDIPITDTEKLFRLLNHTDLNLTLSEGGMMNPEKSCSGFYIISSENIPFPEDNCTSCKAKGNCEYCRKRNV